MGGLTISDLLGQVPQKRGTALDVVEFKNSLENLVVKVSPSMGMRGPKMGKRILTIWSFSAVH